MRILNLKSLITITVAGLSLNISSSLAQPQAAALPLIPMPASVNMGAGYLLLEPGVKIKSDTFNKKAAQYLRSALQHAYNNVNNKPAVSRRGAQNISINLTSAGTKAFKPEEYRLVINNSGVTISGQGAGLFYGIQTFLQLLPAQAAGAVRLPYVTIADSPRFAYRGLMLDVSRHFYSVQQIKNLLDLMAAYKLNRFHWHLTDDQGWRIEIKSYPKLTSVGAWRVPRDGDFGGLMPPPQPGEKATDGGFYTQDQVKEIVRYAAEKYITILPEIDVPGHSMAAVAAYPELSVTKNPETRVSPGSSFAKWFPQGGFEMYIDNTLNPTDERVYSFLDKVFGEVAALFPYEYIHIGGDECFKGYWEKDASVQQFMRDHQIKNTHELQGYFISRLNKIITQKHKKLIGWDEILDGGLNENVAVMNRFGEKSAVEQLKRKLNVILAPSVNGLYFDNSQSSSDMEPISHGGNAPAWKSYNYNPEYTGLDAADKSYLLGIEACVWTEHIPTVAKLQYMMLPRMLTMAETAWSLPQNKSYDRFANTALPVHLARFDAAGFNYRVPTVLKTVDTVITANNFELNLTPPVPGARIYYTLSNTIPSEADHMYTHPVSFGVPAGKKLTVRTIVITPAGHRSVATRTVVDNTQAK